MAKCKMAEEIWKGMQDVERRWKAAQIKHARELARPIKHKGLTHYIRLLNQFLHVLY